MGLNNELAPEGQVDPSVVSSSLENVVKEDSQAKNPEAGVPADDWKPDFKFKVQDKEHEFDEFIRPIVNKENYAKVKELYEKAYGLDIVKSGKERDQAEINRLRPVEETYKTMSEQIKYLDSLLQKNELHTFFTALGLTEEQILKYAAGRLQYKDLPPEQRQVYDSNAQAQQRLWELERENERLSQTHEQQAVQQKTFQLDSYLMKPEVSSIAQNFDQRAGRAGAFRDEIISRGALAWTMRGQDLTPEQVGQELVTLYGLNQQASAPMNQKVEGRVVAPSDKPTLPNLKAGQQSPVKKQIKSIAELRELARSKSDD